MPELDACLQVAIDAGEVDAERGRMAQARYRDLVARNERAGMTPEVARVQAADETIDGFLQAAATKRHATLRKVETARAMYARYKDAAITDPKIVSRDLEATSREIHGMIRQSHGAIGDFLATFRTDVAGNVRERALLGQVVQELHGEATGNVNAAAIGKAVATEMERLRGLFNMVGGSIGKLDDWGLPHVHDWRRIETAGFAAWSADIFDRIDWSRIVNFETGKPFAVAKGARPFRDDAMKFLESIYKEGTTNGWISREPSFSTGGKALANTRGDSRTLHFLTAADWMAYNDRFGAANPFDAILAHIRGMNRDIALMKNWGPNPKAGLIFAQQVLEKDAATYSGKGADKIRRRVRLERNITATMMDTLTGRANVPGDEILAHAMQTGRSYLQSVQLGSAILSQPTDHVTSAMAAAAVGINPAGPLQMTMKSILDSATQKQARDLGWILDSWADSYAAGARYTGDVWQPELAKRLNAGVMKVSGLNFMTDQCRQGVALALMSDLADHAGESFDQLHPGMQALMKANRFGPAEWDALRDPAARVIENNGTEFLSPNYFRNATTLNEARATEIAARYSAVIEALLERAVPTANLRTQSMIGAFGRPGTIAGELWKSGFMYKGYALSNMTTLFSELWRRQGWFNRIQYGAMAIASLTAMGALSVQLKQMASGRDPLPMNDPRFWGQAAMQGGGFGIFGDLLRSVTTRAGGGLAETVAGPVVGAATDLGQAVVPNVLAAAQGKPTHFARDAVNLARRYNPTSTLMAGGVLPVRLAMDRLVWDQLQWLLDPDTPRLWRQEISRLKSDYATQLWWQRGDALPDRAPDLSNIAGAQQ